MASNWPEAILRELEQAQRILHGLETRLRQAKAVDLLAMAFFIEPNPPDAMSPLLPKLPDQPPNSRQDWCLQQLRAGLPLTRKMVKEQFNVTAKTAKRDLSELIRLNLVRYVRTPRPGHYELRMRKSKRSVPVAYRPADANSSCCDYHI